MTRSTVALLRTRPETVLRDYHDLLNLAGYQSVIAKDADTALKVNVSWHFFFPGSSTTPWQLDGVIRAMVRDGYDPGLIHACHNRTVVIDAHLGERENKQIDVVRAHGLRNLHIYEGEEWIDIREAVGDLADDFLCLNDVYPKGFLIPRRFIGENIIHLPTVKTHVFTTTTGAMKNAFGGLLNERRHWTHPVIHETLVDLLMIQRKIHRGVFAVMDGTFAGDGPGPRCMIPHVKNVILASADQVAIDAVAARLMGFDPLAIRYIRLAHDRGLGCGDPRDIQIVGDVAAAAENWRFIGPFRRTTFASRMQHRIYWGRLRTPIEWSLKTVLAPWAYAASVVYHDSFWYPTKARRAMRDVLGSPWGRLFQTWGQTPADAAGYRVADRGPAVVRRTGARALLTSFSILGTCLREAPEFGAAGAGSRRIHPRHDSQGPAMTDFTIRSDAVDVEQIMQRIRARIREKRGVDYTEDEIRELASVKLEKFLDPNLVRSDLIEHYRRRRPVDPLPPLPPAPPHPPLYGFDAETIYESSRGATGRLIVLVRRLLRPILKLFWNPNPMIRVLHMQAEINEYYAKYAPPGIHAELMRIRQQLSLRDDLDALNYEVLNNIVVELTRLGIEVKNMRMRVESFSSRLDFDERRARALEGAVQYRPDPNTPAPEATAQEAADSAGGHADLTGPRSRRRRRRGRQRRPGTPNQPPADASAARTAEAPAQESALRAGGETAPQDPSRDREPDPSEP